MAAPYLAAVRAMARFIRASLCCPAAGGQDQRRGRESPPALVTGGMEVCRNRYVTSVPVTLHQCDGCSGHTRSSTLKATVALWPVHGPPPPPHLPPIPSPTAPLSLHWGGKGEGGGGWLCEKSSGSRRERGVRGAVDQSVKSTKYAEVGIYKLVI